MPRRLLPAAPPREAPAAPLHCRRQRTHTAATAGRIRKKFIKRSDACVRPQAAAITCAGHGAVRAAPSRNHGARRRDQRPSPAVAVGRRLARRHRRRPRYSPRPRLRREHRARRRCAARRHRRGHGPRVGNRAGREARNRRVLQR